MPANPDVRYYGVHNGYTNLHVGRRRMLAEFVAVDAKRPDTAAALASRWALEDGDPVARPA